MSALRTSLGSKCLMYDWSIGLPASVQNSGPPLEIRRFPRSSSPRGFKTTVRLENDAFPGVNQSFETLQATDKQRVRSP